MACFASALDISSLVLFATANPDGLLPLAILFPSYLSSICSNRPLAPSCIQLTQNISPIPVFCYSFQRELCGWDNLKFPSSFQLCRPNMLVEKWTTNSMLPTFPQSLLLLPLFLFYFPSPLTSALIGSLYFSLYFFSKKCFFYQIIHTFILTAKTK